ncbi:MAG: hypothetical protein AAF226_18995, partial [Verrucomicrobiota bacterium]
EDQEFRLVIDTLSRLEQVTQTRNVTESEHAADALAKEKVSTLFAGLNYRLVEDSVVSRRSLASEIWRAFLIIMALALIAEAFLCLPEKREPAPEF